MPKMPPRKEPKEVVVYPSSKRKGPAFKPQRPSKVQRIATMESESSRPLAATTKTKRPTPAFKSALHKVRHNDDEDDEDSDEVGAQAGAADSDSDEELIDDPLTAKPRLTKPQESTPAKQKKKSLPAPLSISSQDLTPSCPPRPTDDNDIPPPPTQLSDPTQIPQPLLVRLLHEHFADNGTKIDKHALQVLQKYLEVFVREAIARTALWKKEAVERGEVDSADQGWLELEDLEKVAGGMMMDF